ncbi:uncharacterized protein LOC130495738 [Raphanus sativus]|uniref:Uncharacterized protein LOC130495738 n=1 Tax=Raphanus sativus TaxID=3726 RepID=A0A9W3BVB0_RAPSA|nr:uncharacterized protein LOC130495738 [Raphanus sativus]
MWIANYDRLPTRSRLAEWGLPISPDCAFCSRYQETRDHLLLSCEFSVDIWKAVFSRCSPPPAMFTEWSELLSWIRSPASSKSSLLRKLVAQTVIYHIWRQRNNLIHNQKSIPPPIVFQGIDRDVRNIISSRRHRKLFRSLMALWFSSCWFCY